MRLFSFIFLVSFILAFGIFTIAALSFIMTLAKAHKVYVQSNSSNPTMMLLLLVPILNVVLGLFAAYGVATDLFITRMVLHCESMSFEEATKFDADPTIKTAIKITRNHNQA